LEKEKPLLSKAGLLLLCCLAAAPATATVKMPLNTSQLAVVQQQTMRGVVTDEQQAPIPGVSVRKKNKSTNGTTTDGSGNFVLNVPTGTTLVFTYIRYESKEVVVEKGTTSLAVIQ